MSIFDKFFTKFAYKFDKGYPDMNNDQDVLLLESLISEAIGEKFSLKEEVPNMAGTKKAVALISQELGDEYGIRPLPSKPNRLSAPGIKDSSIFLDIIKKRIDVGLSLDGSVNSEFQKQIKHKNFIFSNGIDLIHEFFNFERKMKSSLLSKSVKIIGNYPLINKMFTKIADRGILF